MTSSSSSVSIAIPAHNEDRNIGTLLQGILRQQQADFFELKRIYVASDGSTDDTNRIVEELANRDDRIQLAAGEERRGKANTLNACFKSADADVLVLLDADVRLPESDLQIISRMVEPFATVKAVGLVGGNPRPLIPSRPSLAQRAARFSSLRAMRMRDLAPESFMGAAGPIMALSRALYTDLEIPDLPGTDQALYLACRDRGMRFVYRRDVEVYYRPPQTIADYIKQSMRFRVALKQNRLRLGGRHDELDVKKEAAGSLLLRHPADGFCWLLLNTLAHIRYLVHAASNQAMTSKWQMAKSTK